MMMMNQMNMNQPNMVMNPMGNQMTSMMNQAFNQQQNMATQLQQMNKQNSNIPPFQNPDFITVLFKVQIPKNQITIQCNLNDKVSDLIKSYRTKTQYDDAAHEKFIFNGKRLVESLTCAEAGLANSSVVYVINDKDNVGGSKSY